MAGIVVLSQVPGASIVLLLIILLVLWLIYRTFTGRKPMIP